MDRNTIIGLLLIFGLFIGYSIYVSPSKEELAARKVKQDSLNEVKRVQDSVRLAKMIADSITQAKADTLAPAIAAEETSLTDSMAKSNSSASVITQNEQLAALKGKYGVFGHAAIGNDKTYILENDLMRLHISQKGGRITSVELKDYQTYDSLPLILFEKESSAFNFTFWSGGTAINTSDFYFDAYSAMGEEIPDTIKVSGDEQLKFSMRLYPERYDSILETGKYVEFEYILKGNEYMLDYNLNFKNTSEIVTSTTNYIDLTWHADIRQQEKTVNRFNGPTIYYKFDEDDIDFLSESKDDDESLPSGVQWISFKQTFFVSTLVAKNEFNDAEILVYNDKEKEKEKEKENNRYLRSMQANIGVPFSNDASQTIPMSFYFGPNKYKTLRQYDMDLERQIPLGWSFFLMAWINRYAVIPVFNFLESFDLNYGIIILILTILLKMLLFPIARKTYMSSAKMRVLKPEVDEISKKFPKKEQAMEKQRATMALYKKAGANPMSGCVPMLLQFPILLAMFRFFPASIELRQQSFLWADDLSSYDSIWTFPNGFEIPFYGDHVSLFTLLMTISTIMYTYLNNQMMSSSQQMPGMKTMMYIMPIMFLGIFNNYSSGLSYYYLLANLITFAQMWAFRRLVDEDKIRRQIAENKKKPVKKSNFTKRLEEMAKQRSAGTNNKPNKKS